MMRARCRLLVILVIAVLLVACGSPAPVKDDTFYRLVPATDGEAYPTPPLDGTLFIERPSAAGVRRGRQLLYSDDADHIRLRQYHYQHWEDAVPAMVHRWLLARAEAVGAAEGLALRSGPGIDFRLRSRIDRFERLVDGSAYSAAVAIEFDLTNGTGTRLLFHERFEAVVRAEDDTMDATVRAFVDALDRIGGDLLHRLERVDR